MSLKNGYLQSQSYTGVNMCVKDKSLMQIFRSASLLFAVFFKFIEISGYSFKVDLSVDRTQWIDLVFGKIAFSAKKLPFEEKSWGLILSVDTLNLQ